MGWEPPKFRTMKIVDENVIDKELHLDPKNPFDRDLLFGHYSDL